MMIAGDVFAATLIGGGLGIFWKYRNCDCEEMGSGPVMMLGVLAYASWGPLGHADQGSRPRAVASGALRIGLPLAGVALAQKLDRDTGTTLAFAAGGMVSATMIDWFVLGLPARVAKPPVSIYVAPADGGAIAGISGVL